MANKGTCQRMKKFGKCKYSHDPEDIRMFKAAKTLGKDGIQRIAGTLRPQGAYDKTHSESTPKSSSHGAREQRRSIRKVLPARSADPDG